MQLKDQLFDNRVAWRIFVLFLFASLAPLLALGWLLLHQVGNALEQQAFQQLETTARSYGQVTLDKLLSAAELLHRPDSLAVSGDAQSGALGVEAAYVVDGGGQRLSIGDWSPPFGPEAIDAGKKPTLTVVPGERGNDVVIAARDGERVAFARLDRSYALRTDALLGSGMEACLFAAAPLTTPIHCSAPLPASFEEGLLAARQRSPTGRLTWSNGDETWLATYWQLFLPSRFTAEPWTVVVTVSRNTALASLMVFNRVVPQAAAATLVLIVILAIGQIRHTLNPLKELLAGTRRIAARDFATPVRVANRDEFGVLGDALNGMAAQLEHQFGELRALAAIDRSILQTTAIEPVLETLFERLATLVPDGRHLVLIIDPDNHDHGLVYRGRPARSDEVERIKVTAEMRNWLGAVAAERFIDSRALDSLGLKFAPDMNDTLHVAPMLAGDTVAGVLVTASSAGAPLAEREIGSLRELAARVTVAVSAGKREAELFRRAHFDALTGLPNRELLDDRLSQAVAQAQREQYALALLFVDLDGFKEVNDRLGHSSGDELLKETALRLTAAARETDTVARLGGDEYAMLLPQVHGPLEAEAVAVKAIEALRRRYVIGGREAYVSASIGLAMFPDDGQTAAELVRKADMAMYNAKDAGKSCFRFFAEEMDQRLHERHSLHHDLRKALDAGEFTLAYQPQIDLHTGRFVSAEALLRWRHPLRGPVSPALFVPILEEIGLIKEVGAWVLRQALGDFAAWQRAGLPLERVAVNISARQLFDRDFVDTALDAIKRAGLIGRRLEVELTEASLIEDFRAANGALGELGHYGIRISLDDFGTGYSSLAYLNELVFDVLKIDRAFVVNLPAAKAVAIIKAIIAVASALGKEVVAEGIESHQQCAQLMALGCELGQGYRLCRPLEAGEVVAWSETLAARYALADTAELRRVGVRGA